MPAVVEPVAIWVANTVGSWIGATITAAGVPASAALPVAIAASNAAYVVSQIALYAGMQYAVDAVSRPKQKPMGAELNLSIDPAYPREMIIGQRPVGGSMVARYSRGSNLYNAHLVIQLADHPCVELSKVYDGGRLVQDSPLTHGVRTEITAYSYSGGPRVWMTWHDGRPGQTADADLVTKSAQDPEVVAGNITGWSSDHRGAGCAYVHVEVQWDQDILTQLPQFLFLVKGAPLYDRRKDTTAGGSGSHRLDDPSTWEYSTNARVALDHFLLGYKVEDEDLAFGVGLSPGEVPYADFEYGADLCDEDVVTGTGLTVETIKRYAANGVITTADYFEEVIENFQYQMAARVVDLGGRIGVIGAEEKAVVVSLTENDLVAGEPLQFADKLPFSDLFGSVTGTFSDPANLYQPTPLAPLVSAYNALPDGGEAQAVTLQLPYEIHPRRAARLTSAWFQRESLQPRLVGVFMPKAWKLEVGDWFEFTSDRLQVTAAKFEVIDITKNEDFTVLITARAIDASFVAFDNDNDPVVNPAPEIDLVELLLDVPVFTPTATTITGGGATEPVIQVVATAPNPVTREFVIEAMEWNGSALTGPSIPFTGHADGLTSILRQGLKPATSYKVRMKARGDGRESDWSAWSSPVTLSSTYIVPAASSAAPGSDLDADFSAALAAAAAAAASESAAAAHATNAALAETNAETAETAAEAALTAATTQAGNAATSASAAAGSAIAASGSASAAAGSATSASNSATSASGSASAAASSASAAAASASAASGSASAASTSASAASTSASDAATSASAANTAKVAAETAATNSSSSASAAASSASSAAASQSAAASSASAASTSATNAATQASNAATSATNASTSETNAAGSASTASTAATAAAASQSAAAGSASAASSSASTASTQASNAATSASAAATSATSAATQASNASTSASAASTSAGNAASSATTAGTHASNAAGSASSASSSASAASASATAASNSATLSATYAAGSQGSINSSATFADNANATGLPTNWTDWQNGSGTRVTGIAPQPYAFRLLGGAGANAGIIATVHGRLTSGWHVLEADVTLNSGALTGAGVLVNSDPGGSYTEWGLNFATDVDINGSVIGAGATGTLYKFRKLVQITAGTGFAQLYAMSHYSVFGSVAAANSITWHRCALRAASQAEIEARAATTALVTANANIATNASAIATEASSRAAADSTLTARFVSNAAASQNYLRNSSFRDGLTNWITAAGSPAVYTNLDNSFIYYPYGSYMAAYQDVRVEPGGVYSIRSDLYKDNTNNVRLIVQWLNEARDTSLGYPVVINASGSGWTTASQDSFTAPTGAVWARIFTDSYDNGLGYGSTGGSGARRICFTRSAYAQPWAETDGLVLGIENRASIATNASAISSANSSIASLTTTVSANQVVATTIRKNLLSNSTGIRGLTDWTNPSTWTAYEHPIWGHWFSRTFTGASLNPDQFFSAEMAANPGEQYSLSFVPYLAGLTSGYADVYLIWYNSSHGYIGESAHVSLTWGMTRVRQTLEAQVAPTGTAYMRMSFTLYGPAVGSGSYAECGFWQAKVECGATATAWRADNELNNGLTRLATAEAGITTNASAIATETSARAAADTTLTASLGTTNANVSTNASAIATINGAAAFWETVAAASGGTPARIGLKTGASGSEAWIDASNIFLGDNTLFEDPYNSFYTEASSKRYRYGGPFPASGDLVMWYGPTSVALNSETKTNGYFAFATDGKVYLGSAELISGSNPLTCSFSPTDVTHTRTGGSLSPTPSVTATGGGGSGSYSYSWSVESIESGDTPTIANAGTATATLGGISMVAGEDAVGRLRCTVTDTTTGRQKSFFWSYSYIDLA